MGRSGGHEGGGLPGTVLAEIIPTWHQHSNRITFRPFFTALARVMRREGTSDTDICHLFALHSPSGSCADLIDADLVRDGVAPLTPVDLTLVTMHTVASSNPTALATWRDFSPLADGFSARLVAPSDSRMSALPYGRSLRWQLRAIPFDDPRQVSVATTT